MMLGHFLVIGAILAQGPVDHGEAIVGSIAVSEDIALHSELEKKPIKSFEEASRRYPSPRFSVSKWAEDKVVIIDLDSSPLSKLTDRIAIIKGIRATNDGLFLDTTLLGTRGRSALSNLAQGFGGAPDRAPRFPKVMAILFATKVLATKGEVTRETLVSHNSETRRKTLASLRKANGDPESFRTPTTMPLPKPRNTITFKLTGKASQKESEGIRVALERVEEQRVRAQKEADSLLGGLLKATGVVLTSEPLSGLADLPERLKRDLQESVLNSPSLMGFGSKEEAVQFLQSAKFDLKTTLSLNGYASVGNPAEGRAGVLFGFIFGTLDGYCDTGP
jgi:hypothetical protein